MGVDLTMGRSPAPQAAGKGCFSQKRAKAATSLQNSAFVIPAQAGIQRTLALEGWLSLDSELSPE